MSPLFLEDYNAFLNKVLPLESKNRIIPTNHNRFSKNICKLKYIFIPFFFIIVASVGRTCKISLRPFPAWLGLA